MQRAFNATMVVAMVLLLSIIWVPFVWADWPMFHHDIAHTGAIGHLPVVPTQTWNFTTSPAGVGYSSPAVVDGIVYIGSDGVHALDAATGEEIWTNPDPFQVTSSPAFVDGAVYAGGSNGVYALNATNGEQIWYFTTGVIYRSSPAVTNGIVYVGSEDGNIYALNATNGLMLWKHGNVWASSPVVSSGVVYVGGEAGVLALNASDGSEQWAYPGAGVPYSSPAVVNDVVYVGSYIDFYALKANNGEKLLELFHSLRAFVPCCCGLCSVLWCGGCGCSRLECY